MKLLDRLVVLPFAPLGIHVTVASTAEVFLMYLQTNLERRKRCDKISAYVHLSLPFPAYQECTRNSNFSQNSQTPDLSAGMAGTLSVCTGVQVIHKR